MPDNFPCATCDGEGILYLGRLGPNDPDVRRVTCTICFGTGNRQCEDCGDTPATIRFTDEGKYLCRGCLAAWMSGQ